MVSSTTLARATRKTWFTHVIKHIFELDPDTSDLGKFFASTNVKIHTFEQLLNYPTKDLNKSWEYQDDTGTQVVAFSKKQMVKIFQAFYAYTCEIEDLLVDPLTLTAEEFDDY